MNIWLENSIKNLLPLSKEKKDFKLALKEWIFSGDIIDYIEPNGTCELCEKDELRYHFKITNILCNELWVGSQCIQKFDITVYDESGNEYKGDKDTYLQKRAREFHISKTLKDLSKTFPIGKLDIYEKRELDHFCVIKYKQEHKLDAKMLNYLFMRFEEEGLKFDKRFFRLDLRGSEQKMALCRLNGQQFERIKAALTLAQRNYWLQNNK